MVSKCIRPRRSLILSASKTSIPFPPSSASVLRRRKYATQSSNSSSTSHPSRNKISVVSDDGRVHWSNLSVGEKAARTTQQSFNFLIILAGLAGVVGVSYALWGDVFSADSKTRHFNRTSERIKQDDRCLRVLGDAKKLQFFGEASWSRWQRNRFIAGTTEKDRVGVEHLKMHFNVAGPLNRGVVRVHLVKRPGQREYEYRYLALEVPGHQTIYLENADADKLDKRGSGKMFGVRWW